MLSFAPLNQLRSCSSVSVAMEEDYIIFFSGEGEGRVERRAKKTQVTAERLAQIFRVGHTADYCNWAYVSQVFCFRGECMWQLWKNLKGWWCGTLTSTILVTFQFHVTGWGPWVCISSITIICGMTYSKYLCQALRCNLRFFSSSFYSSFSFSWEKNIIFLHCSKIETDLKKQMTATARESIVGFHMASLEKFGHFPST